MMKQEIKSFEHFLETCTDKTDFEFYEVGLFPDHPLCYDYTTDDTYYITDLYLVFVQDGGRFPYTIYLDIQRWCPDSVGDITFDEIKEFKDEIKYITWSDPDKDSDILIYHRQE